MIKTSLKPKTYKFIKVGTVIFAWFFWIIALILHSKISLAFIIIGFVPYLIQNQISRNNN